MATTVRNAAASVRGFDSVNGYQDFLAAREERRLAEARRIRERRDAFAQAARSLGEAHVKQIEQLLEDKTMPRDVRASTIRYHRDALRSELEDLRRARAAELGNGRPWYDALLARWRAERGARADYAHALTVQYDDRVAAERVRRDAQHVTLDPVLLAIPGSRRYRADGAFVFTRPTDRGDVEMFRVFEETREVVVRAHDDVALEAAIVKAYQLDGPPLDFQGPDEFCARCRAVAGRYGYAFVTERPSPAPAQNTPTEASQPSPAPDTTKAVSLDDYPDEVARAKELSDAEFITLLDPRHAVRLNTVYLHHAALRDGSAELVFAQKPGVDAITAFVAPRGTVPAHAVSGETRFDLCPQSGAWTATFEGPQQPGPENENYRSRGR